MAKKVQKKSAEAATKKVAKLPKFTALCASTWTELSNFWRPLMGVTLVYALLYYVLVLGFSVSYSYQDVADSITSQLGASAGWLSKSSLTIVNLFSPTTQNDSASIVQFLLFVIATLAIIWVLRQLRNLKHIRMRDAYFEGSARVVPATLVMILFLVPFVPAIIGSSIFSIALAGSTLEITLGAVGAGLLLFLTVYWLCAWLPAIYIVSLPKGTPIKAIRAAAKLTKKRRFWMIRNLLLGVFATLAITFLVMLLFVWLLPVASPVAAIICSFVIFMVLQTYLFIMYRGLLDES